MKPNQISVERQLEEPLWRELSNRESEQVGGGFGFENDFSSVLVNVQARISSLFVQLNNLLPTLRLPTTVIPVSRPRVIFDLDPLPDRFRPR